MPQPNIPSYEPEPDFGPEPTPQYRRKFDGPNSLVRTNRRSSGLITGAFGKFHLAIDNFLEYTDMSIPDAAQYVNNWACRCVGQNPGERDYDDLGVKMKFPCIRDFIADSTKRHLILPNGYVIVHRSQVRRNY